MKEYKVITASQLWTLKGLEEKATKLLNIQAKDGWKVIQMRHGWSGFLFSTLFILLEKES